MVADSITNACSQNPFYCALLAGAEGRGAQSTLSLSNSSSNNNDDNDDCDCGPDTRAAAYQKALAWAGTGLVNDWIPTPWDQYRGRGGTNYTYVRQNHAGANYGYEDPNSRARIFDHPDGHPGQTGPGNPEHHKCPHFHAINADGKEEIFKYKRGS